MASLNQRAYLQSQVGPNGKVRVLGNKDRGTLRYEVRCRHCGTPNPSGGTPVLLRFEGALIREVMVDWLTHLASRQHELARDRNEGSA